MNAGVEKIARYLDAIFLRAEKVYRILSDLQAHIMMSGATKATEMLE